MNDPTRAAPIESLLAHSDWLRALARRLVASDDLAGDVEQETWLAALEHPPRDASSPRQWLGGVLRNIVKEQRRGEQARSAREASVARPEAVAGGDEAVDRAQSLRALIDAVLELEEPYRSTLLLRYQDGLSAEAIAVRHAVPASTVRNRLSRGVAQLRERLERKHGRAWSALLVPLCSFESSAAAATAGVGAFAASLAALTSMATLKLVSAAAAVVVGAALWWTLSDGIPATEGTASAPPVAPATPMLDAPALATKSERTAAEDSNPEQAAPVSAAKSGRGSLLVSVTWGSDGTAASDVVVGIHPWGESSPFAFVASQPTDAEGHARFANVASGSVIVECDRAEGVAAQVSVGEQPTVALTIPPGILVRGQVVDNTGSPVSFARIWLSTYGNTTTGREVARADGLGRFALRDVGDGRHIAAHADGHAPSNSQSVLGQPGDVVELTLRLGAGGTELRGTVRGPDGAALAGAALLIGEEESRSADEEGAIFPSSPPPRRLASDEQGGFIAGGIAAGRTRVQCRARGFAPFDTYVDVAAQGATATTIEMLPGAAVEGSVRDAEGKPAARTAVSVTIGERYGAFASSRVSTAADGSYRMQDLTPGGTAIRFGGGAEGEAQATLMLVAGETAHLDVQLAKRGVVAGRVVDEVGEPLAGLRVGAIAGDRPALHYRSSISDEQGGFRLDNWPSEADALEVRDADRWIGPSLLIVDDVEVGREDVVLTVPIKNLATAFVVGRLRGPDGEAVGDATLSWGTPMTMDRQFAAELSASTGEFRAGPMPPGSYRIWAHSPRLGVRDLGLRELATGQTLDLGEVRFSAPGRVRVRLVGPREVLDGLDDDSMYARAQGADDFWLGQIELDEKLEGRSGPLPAGACTILVSGGKFRAQSASVVIVAGVESEVEIHIERATTRNLRLKWDAERVPKEAFDCIVTAAAGQLVQQMELPPPSDGINYVGVQGLVVGSYWIEVRTADGRITRVAFDVNDLAASNDWIDLPLR